MKKILLVMLLLAGCATYKPAQPTAKYKGILPTYGDLVGYQTKTNRPNVPPSLADQRTKDWFTSVSWVIRFEQQKPIRRKTDLVYIGEVLAYPIPDSPAFPPVRFWVTVDNQGDSTTAWVTNFEVINKRGWEPMEGEPFNNIDPQLLSLRLADLDAMVTVMLEEFAKKVGGR
jgi:hypothetical protein